MGVVRVMEVRCWISPSTVPNARHCPGEGARVGGASGVAQPLDAEKVGRRCCAAEMGSRVDFPADGSETRLLGTPRVL